MLTARSISSDPSSTSSVHRLRSIALGFLFLTVSAALSGCVQTASLPARQLEPGETVASGGAHLAAPVELYGQVTRRVGRGDVNANVGVNSSVLSGGVAARRYLHERLNAEAQIRVAGNPSFSALMGVAGFQTVPSDDMPLYVGVHAGTRSWLGGTPYQETENRFALPGEGLDPLLGGSVGIGGMNVGNGWEMQIELEATANLGRDAAGGDVNLRPASNRLSIGVSRTLD